MSESSSAGLYHAPHSPWLIAIVATIATFMEVLDTSIANVALPHIAGNLGATTNDSVWVLTSYLVANAVILPATAWIGSVIGRRNYYMICVALFTLSSLLCGMAPSMEMLVLFRFLQGLGGGGLQPLTQAIMVDTFPQRLRGMGMALYGMTVVVAPVIGPTFGGWITDNYNWRWVFLINAPIGLLSLSLSLRYISDPPYLHRRHGPHRWRADYLGFALLALGMGSLQLMLDLGDRHDWFNSPLITGLAVATVVFFAGGILWEFRHGEPILNLRVLRDRNLGLCCLHMAIFGGVLFGSTALLPLFMQTLLGYTAQLSGMAVSPAGMVIAVMMPIVGIMVTRFDPRAMIVIGVFIVAYALRLMGSFTLDVDFHTIVVARAIQGLGLSLIFVPINTMAYATVSADGRNSASSLMSIARNIGGSVGIGLTTAMLTRGNQVFRAQIVDRLGPTNPALRQTLQQLTGYFVQRGYDPSRAGMMSDAVVGELVRRQAALMSFLSQFRGLGIAFLLLALVVLFMKRPVHAPHVELAAD